MKIYSLKEEFTRTQASFLDRLNVRHISGGTKTSTAVIAIICMHLRKYYNKWDSGDVFEFIESIEGRIGVRPIYGGEIDFHQILNRKHYYGN